MPLLLLLSHFSRVWLYATPWTAAHQAPPSMVFSRQEYWSGVPLPSLNHATALLLLLFTHQHALSDYLTRANIWCVHYICYTLCQGLKRIQTDEWVSLYQFINLWGLENINIRILAIINLLYKFTGRAFRILKERNHPYHQLYDFAYYMFFC